MRNHYTLGERAIHPMGLTEQAEMEQAARRAELAQLRLEEKRRHVFSLAADFLLVASGVAALIAAQGLSAGRLLEALIAGAAALGGWVAAGIVRGRHL